MLSYAVEAQIGGKLAQLGQRLINGAAKKVADEFFQNFAAAVNPKSFLTRGVPNPQVCAGGRTIAVSRDNP